MQLHNSLTNKLEDFQPIDSKTVTLYSCGPTVYNDLHIGNLSAFIYADTIRRALEINGYAVDHAMNITDVDDKTIRDSKANYPDEPPMKALSKLTDKYTKVFMNDLSATGNNLEAITFISAVQTIPEMINLTQKLLDNKVAYIADDGVYFSITKYYQAGHKYGKLQKVATQQSKSRITNDEYDKDSASDFALWKKATAGEPSWDATFSEDNMKTEMPGRPGWHIECSAMSEKLLGIPFDIHTGGIDLKFPHHENEIAQSCGAGSAKLANYFIHNNHLLVDGKKMSKSLGNYHTLRDISSKGYSPTAFRLLTLEGHYHSESNFSWDILTAAKNRLHNWQVAADMRWQVPQSEKDITAEIAKAMARNIDTPDALRIIDGYFADVEKSGESPNISTLEFIDKALGIELLRDDIPGELKEMLEQRLTARKNKDWQASDEIRGRLLKKGLTVKDQNDGQLWLRTD